MALMEQDVKNRSTLMLRFLHFSSVNSRRSDSIGQSRFMIFFASEFLNITGVRVFSDNNNHAFILKLV